MVAERRELYTPEQLALNYLPSLVRESLLDSQNVKDQYVDFGPGMDLLKLYRRTDRFERTSQEARSFKRRSRKNYKEELSHNFAGQVFRDIAYSFRVLNCDPSHVVLSPERTFELWKILYPDKNTTYHPFAQNGLKNVHVPDGLLVNRLGAVTKILEYSLVRMDEADLEKEFRAIKIQQKKFRELLGQLSIEFVMPLTFDLPRLNGKGDNIQFLQLPITRFEFGKFVNGLYESIR